MLKKFISVFPFLLFLVFDWSSVFVAAGFIACISALLWWPFRRHLSWRLLLLAFSFGCTTSLFLSRSIVGTYSSVIGEKKLVLLFVEEWDIISVIAKEKPLAFPWYTYKKEIGRANLGIKGELCFSGKLSHPFLRVAKENCNNQPNCWLDYRGKGISFTNNIDRTNLHCKALERQIDRRLEAKMPALIDYQAE